MGSGTAQLQHAAIRSYRDAHIPKGFSSGRLSVRYTEIFWPGSSCKVYSFRIASFCKSLSILWRWMEQFSGRITVAEADHFN